MKAFTLIEIMVVVAIIAVLSAMIAPSLMDSYSNATLRSETQRLFDTTRYAQRMAVIKQLTLRLVLIPEDPEHDGRSSYHLELATADLDEPETFAKATGGAVKPAVLPEGVRVVDVIRNPEALEIAGAAGDGGAVTLRFFPDGSADGAVIHLGDDRRVRSIVVEPATGRVESTPQRVDTLPSLREDLDA